MAEIIITPNADAVLQDLIEILYNKEYFGFKDSCKDYVGELYDFCASLPKQQPRKTKDSKYGAWYCRYSHSRKTHWFIFFDKSDDRYIIRHIINNYSQEYPEFIELLK
jgi:hypothetical protein